MTQEIEKKKITKRIEQKCPICEKEKKLIPVNIIIKSQFPDFKSNLNIFSEKLCIVCLKNIRHKYIDFTTQKIYLKFINKKSKEMTIVKENNEPFLENDFKTELISPCNICEYDVHYSENCREICVLFKNYLKKVKNKKELSNRVDI